MQPYGDGWHPATESPAESPEATSDFDLSQDGLAGHISQRFSAYVFAIVDGSPAVVVFNITQGLWFIQSGDLFDQIDPTATLWWCEVPSLQKVEASNGE